MPSTFLEPVPQLIQSADQHSTTIAEANFLRLPLFALRTKGLKRLDGFECRGTTTRNDATWDFVFRTARSTATVYPGLLSRSVHLAFLSLITEHGLPFANPVKWNWRELCRRLEVRPSGGIVRKLKAAIEATAGLTIFSQDALYSKPTGQRMNSRKALHLYDTVVFLNETLPDGSKADANYLWLSGWYLDNLNAMFTAPVDHELWRFLDKQSPIASRLYEFLLINFHVGTPQLKINYPRLAQFLPVRPERYLSSAQKQLNPAFKILADCRIASVAWQHHSEQLAQLRINRGSRLVTGKKSASNAGVQLAGGHTTVLNSVRELTHTAEQDLIDQFYLLWTGSRGSRGFAADLAAARRVLAIYGLERSKELLPVVVEELRKHWPGAKTFIAAEQYIPAAVARLELQQQRSQQRQVLKTRGQEEGEREEREARERSQFEAIWQSVWDQTPVAEQEIIGKQILEQHDFLRLMPHQLQFRCLQVLARRAADRGDTAPGEGETPLRTERKPQL